MSELYWITRFSAINAVFTIIIVVSTAVLAISIIGFKKYNRNIK